MLCRQIKVVLAKSGWLSLWYLVCIVMSVNQIKLIMFSYVYSSLTSPQSYAYKEFDRLSRMNQEITYSSPHCCILVQT